MADEPDEFVALEQTAGDRFCLIHSKQTFAEACSYSARFERKSPQQQLHNKVKLLCVLNPNGLECTVLADGGTSGISLYLNTLYFDRWIMRSETTIKCIFALDARAFAESFCASSKHHVATMALYDDRNARALIHHGQCMVKDARGTFHAKVVKCSLGQQSIPRMPEFDARAMQYDVCVDVDSGWLEDACMNQASRSKYVALVLQTEPSLRVGIKGEYDTDIVEQYTISDGDVIVPGADWPAVEGQAAPGPAVDEKADEKSPNGPAMISPVTVWITAQHAKQLAGISKIHHAARLFLHADHCVIVSLLLGYHNDDPTHPSRCDVFLSNETLVKQSLADGIPVSASLCAPPQGKINIPSARLFSVPTAIEEPSLSISETSAASAVPTKRSTAKSQKDEMEMSHDGQDGQDGQQQRDAVDFSRQVWQDRL